MYESPLQEFVAPALREKAARLRHSQLSGCGPLVVRVSLAAEDFLTDAEIARREAKTCRQAVVVSTTAIKALRAEVRVNGRASVAQKTLIKGWEARRRRDRRFLEAAERDYLAYVSGNPPPNWRTE